MDGLERSPLAKQLLERVTPEQLHHEVCDPRLGDPTAETAEIVAGRIRRALTVVPPERLVVAPDCGMKYLPRELAFAKLEAMVDGARLVDAELQGVT